MPIKRSDFADSNMAGLATFRKWKQEFEAAFIADDAEQAISLLLNVLSPEQKAILRSSNPQAYDSVVAKFKIQ